MNRSIRAMVRTALLLASVTTAIPAQTPPPPQATLSSSRMMTPNFRDTPIEQVAEAVGEVTGVTFIPDPRVRATVSLINPTPMTATQLYYAFLSLLQVHNFAAVRSGQIVKIVPDANVRTSGNDQSSPAAGGPDEIQTTVIEAKNINANQLATALRQLVASYGSLQAVPGTNSIIIIDRASNVARIQRIVSRVDQASTSNIDVIRLENASAGDLVRTLNALTAGQPADAAAGISTRIAADDRTNSILISGDPAQRLRLAAWIAHLDTPLEDGGGTETRYLKYADAEALAAKLKEQLGYITAAAGTPGAGTATAGPTTDRSVSIWGHKETNALVITAPPKAMRQLWSIVDKLDIPRAQVQIEAIIVDVSTTKSADLGVNWAAYSNEQGTVVPAAAFLAPVAGASLVNLVAAARDPASAASSGAVPGGATFAFGQLKDSGLNWAAMIRAFRQDQNANVLSTPSTTTSDNQEAQLSVTRDVPFITGQYTNTGNTNNGQVNPFTTVERQEVGTILKVKPQINGGTALTLQISIESSELTEETGDAGSRITAKRKVTTNVLIEDGHTLVIGGLIRDADLNGETRVPFLGRIPLIGEAFRVRSKDRAKANLMIFIRPKILADGLQASIETNAKYNLMRDAQQAQSRNKGGIPELIPLLPGVKSPELPPIQLPPSAPATPVPAVTSPATTPTG